MDSIFQQLYMAFVSRQGGTVHIRNIIAPLHDPEVGTQETAALYHEADQNQDIAPVVFDGVANAGLYLPDRPVTEIPPEEPTPEELPTENPPPPPVDPVPEEHTA